MGPVLVLLGGDVGIAAKVLALAARDVGEGRKEGEVVADCYDVRFIVGKVEECSSSSWVG